MENKPEAKIHYLVACTRSGQWEVNESGFEKAIASFSIKADAIDYAERLAETKRSADVLVRG